MLPGHSPLSEGDVGDVHGDAAYCLAENTGGTADSQGHLVLIRLIAEIKKRQDLNLTLFDFTRFSFNTTESCDTGLLRRACILTVATLQPERCVLPGRRAYLRTDCCRHDAQISTTMRVDYHFT